MDFKIGDYVTRESYDNDVVFVITEIKENEAILKGYDVRLVANSPLEDLNLCSEEREEDDFDSLMIEEKLDRGENEEFFYLPAKILHLDADRSLSK